MFHNLKALSLLSCLVATPAVAQSSIFSAPSAADNLFTSCAAFARMTVNLGTPEELFQSGACYGFIAGWLDAQPLLAFVSKFCLPPSISVSELAIVFNNAAQSDPQLEARNTAPQALEQAIAQNYPCGRDGPVAIPR